MPCIEVEKMTHIYFPGTPLEVTALRDISLCIYKGEFLALIGTAGSGKTSLVQHFNGLLLPTSGRVRVLGKDTLDKRHRKELWRHVGLVFQFPERQIFGATVYEEISFGVRNMGLDDTRVKRRVAEALSMVGLPVELQDADPKNLSGGMLRRVAIAGVLAMRPDILIMDEPAAGLEPAAKNLLLTELKKLQQKYGTTLVLITHNLDDASVYADRVALLKQGRLLDIGKVARVLSQTQLLKDAGLISPFAVELADRLSLNGIKMPGIPITIEEAARMLIELISVYDRPGGYQC